MYDVTGSLDGVLIGKRVVRSLLVNRLDPDAVEGLGPLVGFEDLNCLGIGKADRVGLSPLHRTSIGELYDGQPGAQRTRFGLLR